MDESWFTEMPFPFRRLGGENVPPQRFSTLDLSRCRYSIVFHRTASALHFRHDLLLPFRFISNVVCNHLPALHLRRRLHFCNVGNTLCEAYQKFGPKLLVCYFAPLEYDCRFDLVSLFEKSAGMPHF